MTGKISDIATTVTAAGAGYWLEVEKPDGTSAKIDGGNIGGKSTNFNPPLASSFSSVASNGSQPTFSDTDFGLGIDFGLFATNPIGKLAYTSVPSPSASWYCDIVVQPAVYSYDQRFGVGFFESSTGKACNLMWDNSNNAGQLVIWTGANYSNSGVTLGSGTTNVLFNAQMPRISGFRLQYDLSSDRYYFYMAVAGGVYIPQALNSTPGFSATRTSQFTTRADSVAIMCRNGATSSSGWNVGATVPYLKFH